MAYENIPFRSRKGRLIKNSSASEQEEDDDYLEQTVSVNEARLVKTVSNPVLENMNTLKLFQSKSINKSPEMAKKALLGRTAAGTSSSLKKMASEPFGLTGMSQADGERRNQNMKPKTSPLENYAVLEEIGDSSYGKVKHSI
jgi:hypothetical protein